MTKQIDFEKVTAYLQDRYSQCGVVNVSVTKSGSVYLLVEKMINSNISGWMFAGYLSDIIKDMEKEA